MKWLRLYHELLYDRKIARIARTEQLPKSTVLGAWIGLLILASESPERGKLQLSEGVPLEVEEIGDALDLYGADLMSLLTAFIDCKMLTDNGQGLEITNWEKRQYKSDNSTARVKRFRDKQAKRSSETGVKRFSNGPDTDTDTDPEQEKRADARSAAEGGDPEPTPEHIQVRDEMLELWGELFPNKVQPKPATHLAKIRARIREPDFKRQWRQAMAAASELTHLQKNNWFQFEYFVRNESNWTKCRDGIFESFDEERYQQNGRKTPQRMTPAQKTQEAIRRALES